ncbi:hypothetical protein [Zoogloea sp.]|uniref:hypothetical protein n=1 Tax=Zoogloea sp. TaxID=49181 RepID=UPI0035B118A3
MNASLKLTPAQVKQAAAEAADPQAIVRDALARLPGDKGAVYEDEVIEALRVIRRKSEAEYARLIANVKGQRTRLDKLTKGEGEQHDSPQDMVLAVARQHATYAHTAEGAGVALIEIEGRQEVHMLNSTGFDRWVRGQVYAAHKVGIPDQAMKTAIATLGAVGTFEGPEVQTYLRCAKQGDAYYLDLCDDGWKAVRIAAGEWSLLDRSPVLFVRTAGARPLPQPGARGNVNLLWKHLNIPKDARPLVLAWLLDAMRPDTPYPVLELAGEMGSSKSTTQRRLRALIDPVAVPLRGAPKCVEDIHIAAANAQVCSFENLSSLSQDMQDALCILSTGGGYATRQLYTNGEEHVITSKRPVMLNGINGVATAPDLIERVITVELPTIAAAKRQDEQSMEAAWLRDYPAIFTGLLTLFAEALEMLPKVEIPEGMQKRMLDYQRLGEAVCMALGGKAGEFSQRLDSMHGDSLARGLESYGVAVGIQMLAARPEGREWEGTYLQLLTELNRMPEIDRSNWPRSPRHLSGQLKRIAPGLRRAGVRIEAAGRGRTGAKVRIVRE